MEISEVTYLIIFGSIAFIIFIVFIGLIMFRYYKRNHLYHHQISLLEYEKNQAILQSQLEIQEQTLQHISNELHDNVAQVASVIKMNLHTIKFNDTHKAEEKVKYTQELVKQLITDIKALSVNLNGERVAKIGLAKALETEIERINKTELFTAVFETDNNTPAIDDDKIIILYRMVQETLNNMVKHSNAKEIKLKLNSTKDLLRLNLSDDGNGFDVEEKLKNGTGAGLYNLQKRAKLINATLTINSQIGSGTSVIIEYPYHK